MKAIDLETMMQTTPALEAPTARARTTKPPAAQVDTDNAIIAAILADSATAPRDYVRQWVVPGGGE